MPKSETTVTMPSIQLLGCRAASRPRGMPRPTAKIRAPIVSRPWPEVDQEGGGDLAAVDEAGAEVAMEQPAHVFEVLDVQGLVEPFDRGDLGDRSGVACCPRIATAGRPGQQTQKQKEDDREPDEDRHCHENAPDDEPCHVVEEIPPLKAAPRSLGRPGGPLYHEILQPLPPRTCRAAPGATERARRCSGTRCHCWRPK